MDDLMQFIIEAKKASYATQGDMQSVTPLLPGTKQLEYRSGDYFYRDIYAGMLNFAGQEIVYCETPIPEANIGIRSRDFQEKPIWSMSYAGGLLEDADKSQIINIYSVLREALRLVCAENPFRGPKEYFKSNYTYTNETRGTFNHFNGHEVICNNNLNVYELFYSGGTII